MHLLELRDRVNSLPTIETKLDNLKQSITITEREVLKLLNQYGKESHDVERIQKDSFSTFLFRLVGKYENKLEKEQLEQFNAKISYDRAVTRLEQLVKDRDYLTMSITALNKDKIIYEKELDNRRHILSELKSTNYVKLENEHKEIISQITEIEEALKTASLAISTAKIIAKSLDSSHNWSIADLFTRGRIFINMAKYSHIDEAERNFHILAHNLQELKTELNDVNGLNVSEFKEISSGQRTIDFWFDNIFTDLSVLSKINDNSEQIYNLIKNINKTQEVLESKHSALEKELDRNKHEEEKLLCQ